MTERPCAATGATVTINTTCCNCGHNPEDSGAEWVQCHSCGKVYCSTCVTKRRAAGAVTACPCCGAAELSAAG